jgi:8-oxo-dGTP diphosphatase
MTWVIPEATAYGGILLNSGGQVLLREPANHYDGYVWTFAKTRPQSGETPEQTACRGVRGEVGHDAKVIGVLPGVYNGGTTTNAYFLMISNHGHGSTSQETQSIRWASFEEARVLIKMTTNPVGRQRDLQILEATQRWLEVNYKGVIAFEKRGSSGWAIKGDWMTEEIPDRFVTLPLDFYLGPKDAEAIRKGYIPSAMEEKWFSYFVDNKLYQHRSWTGFLIDRISFVEERGGLRAVQADVNRQREQYSQTDDAEDVARIELMVRKLAEQSQSFLY